MQVRRYEIELQRIMDTLYSEGIVTVHENKLKLLVGATRIRENFWRIIRDRWLQTLEENNDKEKKLFVIRDFARMQYIFTWTDFNKDIDELC